MRVGTLKSGTIHSEPPDGSGVHTLLDNADEVLPLVDIRRVRGPVVGKEGDDVVGVNPSEGDPSIVRRWPILEQSPALPVVEALQVQ